MAEPDPKQSTTQSQGQQTQAKDDLPAPRPEVVVLDDLPARQPERLIESTNPSNLKKHDQ